jgi:hypothetical protein
MDTIKFDEILDVMKSIGGLGGLVAVYKLIEEKINNKKKDAQLLNYVSDIENGVQSINQPENSTLDNNLQETIKLIEDRLTQIRKKLGVWKEAYKWLDKEQRILVENAIRDVFEHHPDFKNYGRPLHTKDKQDYFYESIKERLTCIRISLKYGSARIIDSEVREKLKPRLPEPDAYIKAFNSIKKEISIRYQTKNKPSKDAADVLLKFIDLIAKEQL